MTIAKTIYNSKQLIKTKSNGRLYQAHRYNNFHNERLIYSHYLDEGCDKPTKRRVDGFAKSSKHLKNKSG